MKDSSQPTARVPARQGRSRVWLVLVLASMGAAIASIHSLNEARSLVPDPLEVPVFALERHEGRLCRRGTGEPFIGWAIERFSGGRLKSRSSFSQGLLHGLSEGYFTNGVVQVREHFAFGVQEGPRQTWYPSGQRLSEGTLVAGQQEGTYRRWHENGQLAVEAEFLHGKPNGPSLAWHESGFLKTEASMRDGEIEDRRSYDDGERRAPALLARTQQR